MTNTCQYCGATLRFPFKNSCEFAQANKSLISHEVRCKTSSKTERTYFLANKRWPMTTEQKAMRNASAKRRRNRV